MISPSSLTWIVTLPAIAVVCIALVSHNVIRALLGGIITAALVVHGSNLWQAGKLIVHQLLIASNLDHIILDGSSSLDHAHTIGFLICLGILIECITHTGGIIAYARYMKTLIWSKKAAEMTPLIASPLFFLDDYLNNLVGGAVVRPLFMQWRLAGAKLAYILNAVSSSQCLLIPASSWVVVILGQLESAGISTHIGALVHAEAFTVYSHVIPLMLYPIVSIVSAWFIVSCSISYGPMAHEEAHAIHATKHEEVKNQENSTASLRSFIVPLGSFLCALPLVMLYCAGWHPWQASITFCQALGNTDQLLFALWRASLISVIVSGLFFFFVERLPARTLLTIAREGALSMKNSIVLLILAWTFSALLKDFVHTGAYCAHLLVTYTPLAAIPLATFITATLITALIGSSWGMMSILIPLMLPIIATLYNTQGIFDPALMPLLLPTLGAIFSGAAAGPHISPITDAAIISSTTGGINPLLHIRTMVPYALPGIVSSCIGFYASTHLQSHPYGSFITLGITLCSALVLITLAHYLKRK